ncbi:GNAT family N-acetyltransferase [Phenylobacterium sp. J367]|uniref:GNAT family N-acetyltransferase n=1 Tax=Phenylobacterium sp. J367 TaxID=2898435 RepID=UPI002150F6A4|nr:GNAT family N-acetyltransferase [Phenylobacterium sp. J367]MCR5877863.1 GNAT family N-acetyltransferase [Phenylobacterium sp. J367]
MPAPFHIRRLAPDETGAIAALADVLLDCVAGGASVSFMADTTRDEAEGFWRRQVEAGDGRAILVAEDADGIFGVVQVIPAGAPNQPHRADIAKMLVHRRARRRGVGEALMRAAEAEAKAMGKSVLVLDTVTGEAGERLYARVGWTRVGVIPDYALLPDGRMCATTYFYKALA